MAVFALGQAFTTMVPNASTRSCLWTGLERVTHQDRSPMLLSRTMRITTVDDGRAGLGPRHLGMAGCQFFRDVRRCFADDAQLLGNRATQHLRSLKRLEFDSSYELGNVIGGLDNVVEIETLMPHTQSELIPAPSYG